MARETKVRPTFVQSSICTILLLLLSLSTLPLTLFATTTCYIVSFLTNNRLGANTRRTSVRRRTILITGARANKALTLIRAFKREGHRVVAADEENYGRYAMSRFSRGVDSYWLLPDPSAGDRRYIDALKRIVMEEGVDAWIPCSSVQATILDAEAAKEIREEHLGGPQGCECFIPEPFVAGTLHWKDQFEDLLRELSIDVPDSKVVTSVADAVDFLHSPETQQKGHKYILKCLTLDDLGRDDLTLFPLSTSEETSKHLSNIPTPITKKDPFLLQQFLHGPEYCTHVAARDGELVAFVACRSNQLLMRYVDVINLGEEERDMGVHMEKWSQDFLDLYKAKLQNEGKMGPEYALTGHFSFDFIYEVNEQKLYTLECNVRAHTAVALFSSEPTLASHYLGDTTIVARPAQGAAARSWLAHALPLTIARALIPSLICPYIHPQLQSTLYPPAPVPHSIIDALGADPTASPPPCVGPLHLLNTYLIDGTDKDGVWDWTDPVPFFVLCHVTWPWLLWNRMRRGVAWSRVNVSTSRVFEC